MERVGVVRRLTGRNEPSGYSRCELTSESVDDETKHHGEHGDDRPVGELLVLHAAVDGYAGLMALQANARPPRLILYVAFTFNLKTRGGHLPESQSRWSVPR